MKLHLLIIDSIDVLAEISGLSKENFISITLAFLTLIVSLFTLRSQRKTQKNTENIYTYDNILSDIKIIGRYIINNTITIFSMIYFVRNSKSQIKLSPYLFTICFYDDKLLHSEFFFNKEEIFELIMLLKKHINEYNSTLSLLQEEIKNQSDNVELLNSRLKILIGKNFMISKTWTYLFLNYYSTFKKRRLSNIFKMRVQKDHNEACEDLNGFLVSYVNTLYNEAKDVSEHDKMRLISSFDDSADITFVCYCYNLITNVNKETFKQKLLFLAQFWNKYLEP